MDCTLRIGDLKPDRQSPPGDLVDDWLKDRAALSTWPGHPRCRAVLELVIGKRMSVGAGGAHEAEIHLVAGCTAATALRPRTRRVRWWKTNHSA